MDIKGVINEEIVNFLEGVGDKYAQNKFNIPDKGEEFEKRWSRQVKSTEDAKNGQKVGEIQDDKMGMVSIFKNPTALDNFGPNVRAISDNEGNLYVAQFDGSFVHGGLSQAIRLPDTNDPRKYITWVRAAKGMYFYVTTTFGSWYDQLKQEDPQGMQRRIDVLRQKHPNYKFLI